MKLTFLITLMTTTILLSSCGSKNSPVQDHSINTESSNSIQASDRTCSLLINSEIDELETFCNPLENSESRIMLCIDLHDNFLNKYPNINCRRITKSENNIEVEELITKESIDTIQGELTYLNYFNTNDESGKLECGVFVAQDLGVVQHNCDNVKSTSGAGFCLDSAKKFKIKHKDLSCEIEHFHFTEKGTIDRYINEMKYNWGV